MYTRAYSAGQGYCEFLEIWTACFPELTLWQHGLRFVDAMSTTSTDGTSGRYVRLKGWSPKHMDTDNIRSYGTYDHLVLILGRLANFASRDVVRKRRIASKAGTFGPSGAPPGSFPGMMPAASRVPIPKGFSPRQEHEYSPKSDTLEDQDLDALTALALVEWEGIKAALEEMRLLFGPEFEPMPSDLFPASTTPFGGPPARFKTYSIAGMWMNYYMGMIVLHRSHPSMPPVAMMAAGRAAQDTGRYAMEIGRIAAGLEEHVPQLEEISTLVGAAFIESSFCLFVAGVQVCPI